MVSFALWLTRVLIELSIMAVSVFCRLIVWFISLLMNHEEDIEIVEENELG